MGRLIGGHSFCNKKTTNNKINGAMRRAVADLAHHAASSPACAPGRKFPPVTPRTEAEDYQMRMSVKSRAEEQFAAIQKKAKQALKEKEKARQEIAERVARLRTLRLAKEAADKEAAEEADAEKAAAKTKKPSRLPQAHRH
ncbi:MAG: hypothetical protein ACE5H8_00680 [Alphaproteobacteria bacterium]